MKPLAAQRKLTKGIGSKNALGQLKFASQQSKFAGAAGNGEAQASYAASAFDQAKTDGGALGGSGGGLGGSAGGGNGGGGASVPSLGAGAPVLDTAGSVNGPCATTEDTGVCTDVGGVNVTPCQGAIDQVNKMRMWAGIAGAAGLVLLLLGLKMLATPWGPFLLIAGVALLGTALFLWTSANQTSEANTEKCGSLENQGLGSAQGLIYTSCTGAAGYCKPLLSNIKQHTLCMESYREKNCRKL
jgi:hypothetical protein